MTTAKLHAPDSVLPDTSSSDCYSRPLGGAGMVQRRYIMRRLKVVTALLAALILPVTGLMTAAPAMASNVSAIYKDCEANGQLTGHYSRAELQAALNDMPSEMAEYSDCQDIIQRALLSASTPTSGHHNSSGSTTAAGGGRNGGGGSGGKGSSGGAAKHSSKGGPRPSGHPPTTARPTWLFPRAPALAPSRRALRRVRCPQRWSSY